MKLTQRFLRHSLNPALIGLLVHLSFASLAQAQEGIVPELLYKVHGDPEAGDFGAGIAGLGDIDRDGIGDFAVTASWTWYTERAGRRVSDRRTYVRIFSGRDGLELYTIRSEPFEERQFGEGVYGSGFALGDLDGDQVPEFIFNMPYMKAAAIISGQTGEVFRSYELEGRIGEGDRGNMGDLDQDGFMEYMIDDSGERASGFRTSRIHSGRTGEILLRMKWGKDEDDPLRPILECGVSDLNGDGVPEIALRFIRRSPRRAMWIVSGALRGEHFLEDLSDADILLRYEEPDPGWGGSVSTFLYNIGDLDGDGFSEIARQQGWFDLGWGFVVFSTGTGEPLWQWKDNPNSGRNFARHFCDSIGDIDGDGVRDIVADALGLAGEPDKSQIVVFSGRDGEILSRKLMASSPRPFGIIRGDASTVDDLNGDGILEIAVVDDHSGPGRVGIYSYGPGPTNYLGDDYLPRLGFVEDDDQRFVVWPAVVDSPIVETSTDLKEWNPLFDEAPSHGRFPLPEEFESGTRYFRLRYQRQE